VDRHQVSEEQATMAPPGGPWDDGNLAAELGRYEQACREAGMRPNAIHYWDYARASSTGGPVVTGHAGRRRRTTRAARTAAADELERQAADYARAIEDAGREQATIDTYHRHAMFFIRWLRGAFRPGDRLR
jgi:hypothetical protein